MMESAGLPEAIAVNKRTSDKTSSMMVAENFRKVQIGSRANIAAGIYQQ